MSCALFVLCALLQAHLPVQISAASLRSTSSSSVPDGYATESPAGSEEEEEGEDGAPANEPALPMDKEQVLQVVQQATEQAPDQMQKQAFLAWLAAGRKQGATVKAAKIEADVAQKPTEEPAKGAVEEAVAKDDGSEAVAKGGSHADDDAAAGNTTGGDSSCTPACAEGRGLCSDKVCFCRSPYTGMSCEKFREVGSVRFGPPIVVAIVFFSMLAGSIIAVNVFKMMWGHPGDIASSSAARDIAASNTKEMWRPTKA